MTHPRLGTVYLRVADLTRMVTFYQDIIGLQVIRQDDSTTYLGIEQTELIGLMHTSDGVRSRGKNGLYHFAILLPSRRDLALALQRLIQTETPLQGISDHLVSEAVYLADPEGNGIELYADRPREAWYDNNGQFQMATLPVDVPALLREANGHTTNAYRIASGTVMGHIHLHVDRIADGTDFYQGVMEMAQMFHIGSAAFLAYDGYHHHIGVNTWAGRVPRGENLLGLAHYELFVDKTLMAQPAFQSEFTTGTDGWWRDSTHTVWVKAG
jgi:catechol 2,3-dioxygenase